MADLDVEALLEAPFNEARPESSADGHAKNGVKDEKDGRDRSRSRDRGRSDRDRDRDHRRRRSRSRSRDRRSRSRSRDRDRHSSRRDDRRDRDRDRERERDRDRDRHRDSRDRDSREFNRGGGDRGGFRGDGGRGQKRENKSPPPELLPPGAVTDQEQRAIRTVFVLQLPGNVKESDLEQFFLPIGKVRKVTFPADRGARRSKGVAYVEFFDLESVPKAIAMTGQRLNNAPVIVQESRAERNRPMTETVTASAAAQLAQARIYVGSLHFTLTERDIKSLFEPFGEVVSVSLAKDEHGQFKGFGHVQFRLPDCARRAIESLDGFNIAGRSIKVQLAHELSNPALAAASVPLPVPGLPVAPGAPVGLAAGLAQLQQHSMLLPPTSAPLAVQGAVAGGPIVPVQPSQYLLLKNMFDPSQETEPDWQLNIRDDVLDECTKFGEVYHIHVDAHSQGFVYLKFHDASGAQGAQRALHGRTFAGRTVMADFLQESAYLTKFPDAASMSVPLVADE